jgi:hypothetical protein
VTAYAFNALQHRQLIEAVHVMRGHVNLPFPGS